MNSILYLEDGTVFMGKAIGKKGITVGELVFNTSMTGYQEILTDPSYRGQIINMCYPYIGNYGINYKVSQSDEIQAKGIVVKNRYNDTSHYLSENSFENFLIENEVVGICGVDTRSITKKIRSKGTMKCVICSENESIYEIRKILNSYNYSNLVEQVSTKEIKHIDGVGFKVALIDFGSKKDIIRNLVDRKCDITIFPYNASYDKIMKINPDGIILSNGPGDPKDMKDIMPTIKKIVTSNIPVFGICLGHQLMSLAFGGDTYKMKFGHRGGNHGVYDVDRDKAYITSQNHGYAVRENSLNKNEIVVTHINLNDNTVEGIKHKKLPVFSVQFHPEGSPGPTDTSYLFDKFLKFMTLLK
ncbi:glutamine-hydrolyzing carbamoyl-phosphate synthase small subunit [Clostridium sp. cel8]|jgi:carbamoyl-phosphate synthase small subunit|uniref:glutamine-hydrolyzing carbamoyl-phosphate synthase small subunit n=1 Tax=Clostridium sp. cel8 TaxID=2663123 RepID=UPI0015F47399|nr:glutamine-hydrolyzing carbamoyl-phosphate synthase small subunit [Clostridium sp. cel8]MBA5850310.1 glutamine-hydrolyzing carbamoyl-phosphate synthase small subunit [Clostridium sp. cel8]